MTAIFRGIALIITVFAGSLTAQVPGTSWLRFSFDRSIYSSVLRIASDGGYLSAHSTVSGPALIQKLDSSGNLQWRKRYSNTFYGLAPYSIAETLDGGYIVAGSTFTSIFPPYNFWLMKIDGEGNLVWSSILKLTDNWDILRDVLQTSDGGYLAAGTTCTNTCRIAVLKLDSQGNILWEKAIGSNQLHGSEGKRVLETSDGGFVVTGITEESGAGLNDIIIAKLDSSGSPLWEKTYGTQTYEDVYVIQNTIDGGLILSGSSWEPTLGPMLLKLDSSGNMQWQQRYPLTLLASVEPTQGGGYLMSGYMDDDKAVLLRVNSMGTPDLFQMYPALRRSVALKQMPDGGYKMAGGLSSYVTSINQLWFANLDTEGNLDCSMSQTAMLTVDPSDLIEQQTNEPVVDILTIPLPNEVRVFDVPLQSSQYCPNLFFDNFSDAVLANNWTYRGSWDENKYLTGSGTAVASPAFPGCDKCTIEADFDFGRVGRHGKIALLGWYKDPENSIEILMNRKRNRIVMRQRVNGAVVRKKKSHQFLDTSVGHHVKVVFDGKEFTLHLDSFLQMSMRAFPGSAPFGTVGFQAKEDTGKFGVIAVNAN